MNSLKRLCKQSFEFQPDQREKIDPVGDPVDPVLIPWRRFAPLSLFCFHFGVLIQVLEGKFLDGLTYTVQTPML